MRIFHYHPYALIYIGQGLADADRETPGEWIVPAYATKIEPPPQIENNLIVFDIEAQAWKYQPMPIVVVPDPDTNGEEVQPPEASAEG
ncbi:hypothetical protein [Herbaspirillum autotrophicum]|uniref:hypothetical protein n=1 Tax=Herbaspirillum autotrophicum TaxID=180195 RepID=UPI00067BF0D6|nr:hypothetical protein [Herbaspirillum autotrophicum]